MRVTLLYPPPWIISPDETVPSAFREPEGGRELLRGGDLRTLPYGLLTLTSYLKQHGIQVETYNISTFAWAEVGRIVRQSPADVFGLSCLTLNRRGVDAVSRLIKRIHPGAHVTVGGPHPSALPLQVLRRYPGIDTVVVGEGEETLLELCQRLAIGGTPSGISGLAWRSPSGPQLERRRPPIGDLDSLPSPLEPLPVERR